MSSAAEKAAKSNTKPTRLRRYWREWRAFVYFVIAMLIFRGVVADWNQVPSGSMIPTILKGDRIVVDKLGYDLRVPLTSFHLLKWADPKRGDIVTFTPPESYTGSVSVYVKRLVGVPGDTVELRDGRLIINGVKATYKSVSDELNTYMAEELPELRRDTHQLREETILGQTRVIMESKRRGRRASKSFEPVIVPEDSYIVMGDNRDNSVDYRAFGFLSRDQIWGRAYGIAFSLDDGWMFRIERFFTDLS